MWRVEAHGNSGKIINIGSVAGATLYPGGNVYGATKAFVEQITRNLRATNLAPGLCGGSEFSPVGLRGNGAVAAKATRERSRSAARTSPRSRWK